MLVDNSQSVNPTPAERTPLPRAKRPLSIAIVARAMSHALGGVPEYTAALTRALVQAATPHRFTVYYSDRRLIGSNPEADEVYIAAPHKFLWDHAILPLRLRQDRPDVVWFPQNNLSLGVSAPAVVSVTDMLYFRVPEFPYREYPWPDTIYARLFMPRSLRRARRVMAISNHTARDITRLLGIAQEKMRTIYLAPADRYRPLAAEHVNAVREKYDLRRPFYFYAGVLSVRKNVRVLVEAFARIAHELPHDLVLTGGHSDSNIPIEGLIAAHNLQHRVRRLGHVPAADLVALYNSADAFIYPSLYEGFGIPPLEAFACGCPVISSQTSSLVEVVGDAALLFDPHDPAALAAHMKTIVSDEGARRRLVEAGFRQARQFSYVYAARELIELLEEAAA